MKANFLLLASFASLPLLSAAQTTSISPKFYVGVGASVLTDVIFRPSSYSPDPALIGPAFTFGMQFSPRLGAQISASYAWRTTGNPDADVFSYYKVRSRALSIPVLLRYSFLPATDRFHVDALGGVTLQRYNYSYDYLFAFPGTVGTPYANRISNESAYTQNYLTLGPAVRYSLTPQLELSATPLVNMYLGDYHGSFRNRLLWNALVGVNYTFGQ